jgi:hypothetical protein
MTPLFPRDKLLGENGTQETMGLFHEFKNHHGMEWTPYTLKEYDHIGNLSMHKIYITCATEYEAAITLLGNWSHWKKLCGCNWFKPYKEAWDEERRLKEETIAKKILIEEAEAGSVPAAKTLYEGPKATKGRPSKQEKAKAVQKEVEVEEFITKALNNIVPIK